MADRVPGLPPFDRAGPAPGASVLGGGGIGGKARGLLALRDLAAGLDPPPALRVLVPAFTVIGTDVFDAFLARNRLDPFLGGDVPDRRIAAAFQAAAFPEESVGDLWALAARARAPLAVRSSSLLEDARHRPFAGVYETKMTPNNQPDAGSRFRKLAEAVKFVYASTFFSAARAYRRRTGVDAADEKMAVIVQDVVGRRHGPRFYPDVSGVGRSFNFYPWAGAAREDGVVELALGLGKSIVDDAAGWPCLPRRPQAPPPAAGPGALIDAAQKRFWAVSMGDSPAFDPLEEAEYLVRADLDAADYDDTLRAVASTYDPASERLTPGTGRDGLRVVTFAPLLRDPELGFPGLLDRLLGDARAATGADVEMEFALDLAPGGPSLGLLQVRALPALDAAVSFPEGWREDEDLLLASDQVVGHGVIEGVADVVYLEPGGFDFSGTRTAAGVVSRLNAVLGEAGRPYLLLGFGRWGSADPWLGVPVRWEDVSGARVLVEASLPGRPVEPSQGSHFFHNVSSLGVGCFHLGPEETARLRWGRLESLPAETREGGVRHVRLPRPLRILIDGRSGRGGILL